MADPEPADDPEAQPEAEELGTKPAELVGQLGSGQVPCNSSGPTGQVHRRILPHTVTATRRLGRRDRLDPPSAVLAARVERVPAGCDQHPLRLALTGQPSCSS